MLKRFNSPVLQTPHMWKPARVETSQLPGCFGPPRGGGRRDLKRFKCPVLQTPPHVIL
jgi:hypothetical protein